ncbi:hypothetical protein F511_30002 [Dorcoceras hygrometricum]|uniref:Uncharacterized protein n=1 Tax=Dorcoceras hygrometricum TaxID=472368 RepID=A0A2Z7CUQ0_9LAMI|nr:hypothetical protein F511_30002 [Dorcoceras hygrometricum]
MDLKPFKLDIDELINDFNECGSNTFAEFKRLCLSRKFSFIFEARPSSNQGFFMRSLYAHSIGMLPSCVLISCFFLFLVVFFFFCFLHFVLNLFRLP